MKSVVKEYLIITLVFLAILTVFYWPAVLGGRFLYQGDLTGSDLLELNVPRRILTAQAVLGGELPLWEPRIGNGTPLLAEGHPGTFYPTTVPLYGLLSPTAATTVTIISTLLIAMLGSYALARVQGASPLSSGLAALAFGLGGTFVFRLKNTNIIQIIAWLPLELAFIQAYARRGQKRYLSALTAVWSLQLLGGHPQAAFICQLTSWTFALLILASGRRHREMTARHCLKTLGYFTFCAVTALMIGSVQLLPTYVFARESSRAQEYDTQYLSEQSFKIHHFARFVNPYCDGNPVQGTFTLTQKDLLWESTPYLGLLPLLIMPWAFCAGTRRQAVLLLELSAVFLLLAFGPLGLLFELLRFLCPGFGFFRYPERFIIPMACFLAILSALGAHNLEQLLKQRLGRRTAALALSAVLLLTAADLYHVNSRFQTYLPSNWSERPPCLNLIGSEAQRIYTPSNWLALYGSVIEKGWYGDISPIMCDVQALSPDLAAIWGVRSPMDYNSIGGGISVPHFTDQLKWLNGNLFNATHNPQENYFTVQKPLLSFLMLNNISHIVTYIPIKDAAGSPAISKISTCRPASAPERTLYIYELALRLPEIRLVPALTSEPPAVISQGLAPMPLRPDTLYEPDLNRFTGIGSVKEVSRSRNTRVIETNCPQDCYLIISETYHPDWQAVIDDGAPQPLLKVNYAFQGLAVPAGSHRVSLSFRCPAFERGWKISLTGLIVWLLLSLLPKKKETPAPASDNAD